MRAHVVHVLLPLEVWQLAVAKQKSCVRFDVLLFPVQRSSVMSPCFFSFLKSCVAAVGRCVHS